jgi:hypothetical protein
MVWRRDDPAVCGVLPTAPVCRSVWAEDDGFAMQPDEPGGDSTAADQRRAPSHDLAPVISRSGVGQWTRLKIA